MRQFLSQFSHHLHVPKGLKLYWFYGVLGLVLLSIPSAIGLRLWVARYQFPDPQLIFVLGGDHRREPAAAELAVDNPDLEVWISSGLGPQRAKEIFLARGIGLSRVDLDYQATDTVTNFTTMVGPLQANDIHHVYLVTSDFHMPRADAIAFWILGSRGVAYTPVPVPSGQPPEPPHKLWRDVARSWLWLLTGRTGSSLNPEPPVQSPERHSSR